MPKDAGYVLAIDFGLKHIGVAVGQTVTRTASGLATVRAVDGTPDWSELVALVDEYRPICIAVGLPLNMDDTESEMSELARVFGAELRARTDCPVEFVDERLTSRAARDVVGRTAGARRDHHEVAAALIAQSWLARYA